MSEQLKQILQQYEALVRRYRASEKTVFGLMDFKSDEIMDTAHILQSHSIGLGKDEDGNALLCVHIQDKRYRNSSLIRWLRKESGGRIRVIYTGKAKALSGNLPFAFPVRPIRIGFSVSADIINDAGTIGFFARTLDSNEEGIVSCCHVIADELDQLKVVQVVQPGLRDHGSNSSVVGSTTRQVLLGDMENTSDAAFASLNSLIMPSTQIPADFPTITGATVEPSEELEVFKVGRTTGVTSGKITSVGRNFVDLLYPRFGPRSFDDVFSVVSTGTGSFCDAGDSGSLIVTKSGEAVGLLFGSTNGSVNDSNRICYGCRIRPILDTLRIEIIPTSNALAIVAVEPD